MVAIELSDSELHLVTSALHSFLSDFGHDQSDILREIKHLLAKLATARTEQSGAGT